MSRRDGVGRSEREGYRVSGKEGDGRDRCFPGKTHADVGTYRVVNSPDPPEPRPGPWVSGNLDRGLCMVLGPGLSTRLG